MRSLADWLEQQQKSHPSAIDLTLARVREVAQRMELLSPAFKVITVAGTNGKGSTVAFVDALLRAAGRKTGRFTSPHLTRYNERICIDGIEAHDAELIGSFTRIDAARGDITLTFFEYNTLAALDLFTRAKVEFAVLEVGLGGRLDATNILDADVGIVCSIGLDHADWLGTSIDGIGREKAGIFRRGRPAILGSTELPGSVAAYADEIDAIPLLTRQDFSFQVFGETWDFRSEALTLRGLPMPALRGEHQVGNAANAIAALVLGNVGVELTHAAASAALRAARVDGRFQIVPGDIEWIFDVAHNVPAAQSLSANLRSLPKRRTLAVCGILGDKDIRGITAALGADIDAWFLAALAGPRAVSTAELAALLPQGAMVVEQAPDVAAACRAARAGAKSQERIVVFGSFLTVGPALEYLGPEFVRL
ncbi:MAG: bifunctional tetrahydrofolate synthase/dihydrofolate synthase [Pseudomonadota bacterium]